MFKLALSVLKRWHSNSLYRNSMYLLAGTFFMSGTGFIFWLIASRIYSAEQIGLTTTLISAIGLVGSFAVLGTSNTLIRFLPTSDVKERKINTIFTVVCITSLIFGAVYLFGLPVWSSKLVTFIKSPLMFVPIWLFFAVNTINNLTDSVFISYRQSQWVLVSNITQSILKIILIIFLPTWGVFGLTGSIMAAILVATVVSLVLIAIKFHIKLKPMVDKAIIKDMYKYSIGSHVGDFINMIPFYVTPIIITQRLGASDTAHYFIASTVLSIVSFIPSAFSRSNFAEISNKSNNLLVSIKSTLRATLTLLVPLVIIFAIFGNNILRLFGKAYSSTTREYFLLSLISIVIGSINWQFLTVLLINNRIRTLIYINIISTTFVVSAILLFIPLGIVIIGLTAIVNQLLLLFIYYFVTKSLLYRARY